MRPNRIKRFKFNTTGSPTGDGYLTASAAGAFTGSSWTINGQIWAVQIDYSGTCAATADLTITIEDPSDTLLQLTNYNTDGVWYPRNNTTYNNGSEIGTDIMEPFISCGKVIISGAQFTASDKVEVTIFYI